MGELAKKGVEVHEGEDMVKAARHAREQEDGTGLTGIFGLCRKP